jgi:hypothetical protein
MNLPTSVAERVKKAGTVNLMCHHLMLSDLN